MQGIRRPHTAHCLRLGDPACQSAWDIVQPWNSEDEVRRRKRLKDLGDLKEPAATLHLLFLNLNFHAEGIGDIIKSMV